MSPGKDKRECWDLSAYLSAARYDFPKRLDQGGRAKWLAKESRMRWQIAQTRIRLA
jgi:hypothetical protein